MPIETSNHAPTLIISGLPITEAQRKRVWESGGEIILDEALAQPERAMRLADRAEVWFGAGLDVNLLRVAKKLRWLQTASVGADYYLFPELQRSCVIVTNLRNRHNAACDHALALMLAIARRIVTLVLQQQRAEWIKPVEQEVLRLADAKVLIIGTGQVGSGIARRVGAFGMIPWGCSRSGAPHPDFANVRPVQELREAVATADWVVNTVPSTPETRSLISADVIAAMKPNAIFISVSRGKTVDQPALRDALASGRLYAAGLDVFVEEPLPADDPLWRMPNVLISPHAAGVMADGDPRSLGIDALVANLARYRAGEPLLQPVDKDKGY
jgi:D-2-hydroxyacid dehydrogenase (NADP+)